MLRRKIYYELAMMLWCYDVMIRYMNGFLIRNRFRRLGTAPSLRPLHVNVVSWCCSGTKPVTIYGPRGYAASATMFCSSCLTSLPPPTVNPPPAPCNRAAIRDRRLLGDNDVRQAHQSRGRIPSSWSSDARTSQRISWRRLSRERACRATNPNAPCWSRPVSSWRHRCRQGVRTALGDRSCGRYVGATTKRCTSRGS